MSSPPSNVPVPPSAAAGSLRRRALTGSVWTLTGHGISQALRLASNLILTRLLVPEAFGLMAIISLVNTGLQLMSNIGVRPAIIRHEHGDRREFLDTAWTIQILRGFGLWAVGAALALPVARFYREPALIALIPVACSVAAIDGFTSTKLITLTRRIELGRIVAIDFVRKVLSIAVMIAIAWPYHTVWALVAGSIVSELLEVSFSHLAIPGPRDRIRWHREYAQEIIDFGKWVLLSTMFTFFAQRIDIAMLGRLAPMDVVGIYSIAIMIAGIPQDIFSSFSQGVLMPGLAEIHRERRSQFEAKLLESKRVLLPAGILCALAGATVSPALFRFLYDPRYWDAGWVAQLAMLPLWFLVLQELNGRALLVLGDSRSFAASNAIKAVASFVACLFGFKWLGLPGLILGLAVGGALAYAFVVLALRAHGIGRQGADLVATGLFGLLSAACGLAPRLLGAAGGIERIALLTLAAGALVLLPLGAAFGLYAWRTLIAPAERRAV